MVVVFLAICFFVQIYASEEEIVNIPYTIAVDTFLSDMSNRLHGVPSRTSPKEVMIPPAVRDRKPFHAPSLRGPLPPYFDHDAVPYSDPYVTVLSNNGDGRARCQKVYDPSHRLMTGPIFTPCRSNKKFIPGGNNVSV